MLQRQCFCTELWLSVLDEQKKKHLFAVLTFDCKQVPDMARKARLAQQLQSKVKAEQPKLSSGQMVSFPIEREIIGRLIGPQGANFRNAQNLPGESIASCSPFGGCLHASSLESALDSPPLLPIAATPIVRTKEVGRIIDDTPPSPL